MLPQQPMAPPAARDAASIARSWQAAILGTGLSADAEAFRQRLVELIETALSAVLAAAPAPERGRAIGAELVRLRYTQPEALSRTLVVLARELPLALPEAQRASAQPTLAALLGEVAAGFYQQARATILDEQEAIRNALLRQQQRAEEARRTSDARFRAIFETAAVSIALAGMDGRLIETNPAMQRMLGYPGEELHGRVFTDYAHSEDLRTLWPLFEGLVTGKHESYEADQRYFRRDGTLIWGHMTVSLVRNGEGVPQFLVAMGEDITARKAAEEALVQQHLATERARLETQAVLDATSEAMLLCSLDGRVLTLNRRAEDLFGMAQETARALEPEALLDELRRRFAARDVDHLLMDSPADPLGRASLDVRQYWPVERELALYSTAVAGPDGAPLGRLFTFRDVTHEREVDRLKSEFVSLVSHELRTPLTSIKGYTDLLLDDDAPTLDEEQRQFLTIIQANADREVALIEDLLDLSRIEDGAMQITPIPLDLAPLVEEAAASFRPQLAQKRQRLVLALPADLPPVLGDAARVAQVLMNLLSNAHKYTPPEGEIAVTAQVEGRMAALTVRDTGIGLSADEQAQVFTRFFRAKNRTTREVGGTGLGLAITRSIVELQGGTISVESAPGEGSIFRVRLPLAEAPADGGCAQDAVAGRG